MARFRTVSSASRSAGHARTRRKINVKLDPSSLAVTRCPSLIHPLHRRRGLVNWDAPEGVAQVGGEIGERAGDYSEEDDSACWIDHR
jgi:hypothetical protein